MIFKGGEGSVNPQARVGKVLIPHPLTPMIGHTDFEYKLNVSVIGIRYFYTRSRWVYGAQRTSGNFLQ